MTDEQQDGVEVKRIGSLSDFQEDRNLILEIRTLDEMTYEIPIRKLSLDEWAKVGREVEDPQPPEMGVKKDGTVLYNRSDPVYLETIEEAGVLRTFYYILACIRIDVKGKTTAAKVKSLRNDLPADVAQALGQKIRQLHMNWRRTVAARADSFHTLRTGEDADIEDDGLDEDAIE